MHVKSIIEELTYSIGSLQNDWVFSKGRDHNSRKSIQAGWRKHYVLLKGNDCLYAESEINKGIGTIINSLPVSRE